jgi:hypothetical protein
VRRRCPGVDLEQHPHDALVRAAVQRALQRADGRVTAECMSAMVPPVTRAANVDAFMPCSACRISARR